MDSTKENINKIGKIIQKDIKLLLRSKTSSLIVILAPLLIMFIVGAAFDGSSEYAIKVGVYAESYTPLTESFVAKLQEEKYVVKRIDSKEVCIDHIKQGLVHTCMVFPPNLEVGNDLANEIVFHVDYSKINLVWIILESLSSKLQARSHEISLDLTQTLLNKLQEAKIELGNDLVTISALQTSNEQTKEHITAMYGSIETLRIDLDNFKFPVIDNKVQTSQDAMHGFQNDTKARVKEIQKRFSEIKSRLKKILGNESGGEYARISDHVRNSIGSLDFLVFNMDSALNESDYAFVEMRSLLQRLEVQLRALETHVNTLKADVKEGAVLAGIDRAITDVGALQASLDKVHANIGGIKVTNADNIASPITTKIEPVTAEASNLNYVFAGLLVLVIMFLSLLLSTTIVVMEKTSPSFFRNFITPTKTLIFVFSSYCSSVVLMFVQIMIILFISWAVFGALAFTALPMALLLLFMITSLFVLLGMFIGYTYTSQETAVIASISVGSLLLLMSNMILPLESMPGAIREVAQFNPFVIAESVLRKALLFRAGFLDLWVEMLILLGYIIILCVFIWLSQKLLKEDLFDMLQSRYNGKPQKTEEAFKRHILEAKKAIQSQHHDQAFYHYTKAHGLYEEFKKVKHPHLQNMYKLLHTLQGKLK